MPQKIVIVFIFILTPSSAFAYIDPGTGGVIIQAIIGILATFSIFFSKIKKKIKFFIIFFKKKLKKKY
jgi:hypothetical protein